MLFRVIATGDTLTSAEAASWYKRFRDLLIEAPDDIVVMQEESRISVDPNGHYAGIEDFQAYFRAKSTSQAGRWRRDSRAVMYWLIEQFHSELNVRCRQCEGSYKGCTCHRIGKLNPQRVAAEKYWAISWESLRQLPLWEPPQNKSFNTVTQRLVLDFLRCIQVKMVLHKHVRGYFQKMGTPRTARNTDTVWRTLVAWTKNVQAIHVGCKLAFGVCCCPNQLAESNGQLAYRIAPNWGRLRADQLVAARSLLTEWVIPHSQFSSIRLDDIARDSANSSYRQKVWEVVRALA